MGVLELEDRLPLRIISFNIRYATTSPTPHEELWEVRCPKLLTQLRFSTAGHSAFISFQEALAHQVDDVQTGLGPSWAHIGVGRDDGKAAGEFSPVFYHVETWRCERSKTYWLSPTPEKPSRGWREGRGPEHPLRPPGREGREESARLILKLTDSWVGEIEGPGRARPPVFLGGDFNSTPEDRAYQTMTAPRVGMTDISTLIPEDKRYGNELTYSSFNEPDQVPKRIDFLFVKDTSAIRFLTFGVLANQFDDGVFLSDHRAVIADIEIPVKGQLPTL
ncbi:hypothetical protein SLS53_000060 [Cytospora paraplurivora]|uniref:Endonuclease/exonuclease/phosphatase domain-containing protein n=1 Tax=Cytospora paraplurivora TaxID=2898453 RepID=A0AAN9UN93_9PEZI